MVCSFIFFSFLFFSKKEIHRIISQGIYRSENYKDGIWNKISTILEIYEVPLSYSTSVPSHFIVWRKGTSRFKLYYSNTYLPSTKMQVNNGKVQTDRHGSKFIIMAKMYYYLKIMEFL